MTPTNKRPGRPVIFGEVLFDRFPDGSSVLGGAPFNVAWHLQGLGRNPLFISRVGDDAAGHEIRQAMQDWGMDTAGLQTDSAHPTGAVQVSLNQGQPSFDILADQAYDHIDPEQTRAVLAQTEPALVYQGSLIARTDHVRQLLEQTLAALPAPLFVDVNLRDPWWRAEDLPPLLHRAQWVKVNDNELDIIAERLGHAADSLEAAARLIRGAYDIELLIVTQGDKGASAFDHKGEMITVKPEKSLEVVDTVGAGDSFSSVVALGLLEGWPLDLMLKRAQAFASRVVQQRGATSKDRDAYRALLAEWGQA